MFNFTLGFHFHRIQFDAVNEILVFNCFFKQKIKLTLSRFLKLCSKLPTFLLWLLMNSFDVSPRVTLNRDELGINFEASIVSFLFCSCKMVSNS